MAHYLQMIVITKERVVLWRPDYNLYCDVYCELYYLAKPIVPNLIQELIKHKLLLASHCAEFLGCKANKILLIVSAPKRLCTFFFFFCLGCWERLERYDKYKSLGRLDLCFF